MIELTFIEFNFSYVGIKIVNIHLNFDNITHSQVFTAKRKMGKISLILSSTLFFYISGVENHPQSARVGSHSHNADGVVCCVC